MITKICNGKIVFENEIKHNLNIYCKDGKICDITADQLKYDECIDAGGMYVSAGFIDLHVHGANGCDFSDGDEASVIKAADFHLKHGTTTIYPTTLSSSVENIEKSLDAISSAKGKAMSNIEGVHLEGPYFSKNSCGAQNPEFITSPVKADYERILCKYKNLVKRWSYAPELENTDEFTDSLIKQSVVPSIGHSDAVYEDVMRVYEKGVRLITHFFSCTSTITRHKGIRRLGIIECGYLLDDMDIEIIADGYHVPKELFKTVYKIKGNNSICLVTDAMSCCGIDKEFAEIGGVPCKIKNGVAYLMDESAFAGSIATADRLVSFCVKDVGLPIFDAVKMITINPARVMNLASKGKIQKDFDADFVIFDGDINVHKVIVSGKTV